ncbi:protein mab-21-like 3 [Ptychodera flava]|uniref:protein mab-21-like 3 n=1 Tax=Ptychodera flava TaxID=63121 RepID=UPI00396A1815
MPVDATLIDGLNYYTDNQVKISRDETKDAVRRVLKVIEAILKYVNGKDQRFSHQVYSSGSYASGLKVSKPDEFDYLVQLEALPTLHWSSSEPRYYNINGTGQIVRTPGVPLPSPPEGYHHVSFSNSSQVKPIWHSEDMKVDRDLVPFKVRSLFKGFVQEAIRNCDLRESVRLYNKTHGPAVTLRVMTGKADISVDLVPTVPDGGCGLPPSVLNNWPRSPQWPPRHKVEKVRATGTDSVAKDNVYWLTSFQRCEMVLLEDIDKDGGCRKQCLRILKKLREDFWCRSTKPVLSSFHLKTLLLWECEKYPDAAHWSRDKLGDRVLGLVRELKKYIKERRCRHYFIPKINLFEDKYGKLKDPDGRGFDFIEGQLDEFLKEPRRFLRG